MTAAFFQITKVDRIGRGNLLSEPTVHVVDVIGGEEIHAYIVVGVR